MLISVSDLVVQTLKRFKAVYAEAFPVMAILFITSLALNMEEGSKPSPVGLLVIIASVILFILSYLALISIVAGTKDSRTGLFGIRAGLKLFWPYLWTAILAGLVSLGGLFMLIIPGIIFSIFLSQTLYIFIVENVSGLKALTKSWHYVRGKWWGTFGRVLVLVVLLLAFWAIVNMILAYFGFSPKQVGRSVVTPLPNIVINQLITAFVLIPVAATYMFNLYKGLKEAKADQSADVQAEASHWVTVGMTVCLVFLSMLAAHCIMICLHSYKRPGDFMKYTPSKSMRFIPDAPIIDY